MSEQPHPTVQPGGGDEGVETHVLEDAIETVYDRPDTHGKPEDSFDAIAAIWNGYLRANGFREELDAVDVSCMMVGMKMARIVTGHYHDDNWVDIAGYAENGARLQRKQEFRCPECGEQEGILPEDDFCANCGSKLNHE